MVEFFPTLEIIKTLKPQPTEGEWTLLNFLNDYLQKNFSYEKFEVYFQSHWDGSFPDIVIMRKNHGILIIEVKDWNLDLYRIDNSKSWTCLKPQGGVNSSKVKSPIAQANSYKILFYNTYSRTLARKNLVDNNMYSLVESAVFFYGSTKDRVQNFFGKFVATKRNDAITSDYITLLTLDQLKIHGLRNTQQGEFLLNRRTKFFDEEIYNELRRALQPSEHSKFKNLPKTLNSKQKELATSKPNTKSKVRGSAGCGKTTVLAYRAVDAYRKTGKPVVILTFNITLCNYISDCISAALNDLPNIEGQKGFIQRNYFIIKHFHDFIKNYRNKHNQEPRPFWDCTLEETPTKYSTILVDEVQDYKRSWMETINKLLADDGEVVFFGDEDQDIYERREMEHIPEVPGRWNELAGTHRLRGKIADLAQDFQSEFLKDTDNKLEYDQIELTLSESFVEYHFMDKLDVTSIIALFKNNPVSNDDICIMSHIVKNVRLLDKALRDMHYTTLKTFENEEEYQYIIEQHPFPENVTAKDIQLIRSKVRHNQKLSEFEEKINKILEQRDSKLYDLRHNAKFNFRMESGKIKLSTIQSYKGWGIDTEILIIGNDSSNWEDDEEKFLNAEMVYVGITRAVKKIIVINIGEVEYDKFFKDWIKNN